MRENRISIRAFPDAARVPRIDSDNSMSPVDHHPWVREASSGTSSAAAQGKGARPSDTKPETLVERVNRLVQPRDSLRLWGNPRLSSTPSSLAIRELAIQNEALQDAVREIAEEVQKLSERFDEYRACSE